MTYETYRLIFQGGAILAAVMLIISVILFFSFDVIRIIGDVSGYNARKEVERIRDQNKNSGVKTYKSSAVNKERGRITDKITQSGEVISSAPEKHGGAMSTSRLDKPKSEETEVSTMGETTILSQNMIPPQETTVLTSDLYYAGFAVEREITFIHTDEVIA